MNLSNSEIANRITVLLKTTISMSDMLEAKTGDKTLGDWLGDKGELCLRELYPALVEFDRTSFDVNYNSDVVEIKIWFKRK